MRDLAAQVTSGLLHFPTATVDALAEDEVTLDSELRGRFSTGRGVLAWLACGPNLEVVHASSGERVSAYRFSGVTDHTRPSVTVAKEFGWLKRSGLLVGLQEDESSMLCLYDLGISRVIKAVVIPNRITAIEPLASYGGASAHTQHLHQSLRWFFGVVAVVTDLGHVLLVDLCLDDLSCTQTELDASDLEVLNKSPADIPRLREGITRQGRHLCLQLRGPTGTGVSALQFIGRTNQLAVGFTDGVLQLWNMKTLKQEYQSQLEGGPVPVYAFTFQEPENDPRNCCYLWAVQSAQDLEGDVVSLHLLQLAFGERKCLASGKIFYEGLEYCEERYSQDLHAAAVPLRAQASNTRLLSCQTIEKFRHHPDREDSVNEVASPDTSVAVFSWQVKSYGQGHPSTYVSVFDINRWYHAQMPDSLRTGESMRSCPYLAVWSMDSVLEVTQSCPLLDVVVHERSLSRALPHTCPPPEQFYNPNTYNFDASCLLGAGVVHFTCCGYQKETLTYLMKSLPSLTDGISNGYSRCLMSGLLSSRLADIQPSSLSEQEQLDAILTMAVETSALGLITGCIKEWSTEERAGSTGNLRYVLEWAWDKVVKTKEELDSICAPLFDCSSNFTDPQTLQLLQRSLRILTNLSTVFHCLLNQAQELTQRGVMGLMNKCMVSSLISQYAQVVLWFCRTGLLPESSDDDVLQISRPFYSFSVIKNYYMGQREELQRLAKDKWSADCLMIDGLVSQCGERLSDLWRRDQGGTGQYPPPSLHALLDLYLLENVEESAKHAIVIYLLLDVMYSFPNKSGASVESFPTAFSIPIGLVKLVQGLWLLDHHDHENALDLLLHPSASQCVWAWQHSRVLQTLMIQNKHGTALRYLHMTRPSLSSTPQIKLCISVLLHNRCTVEAWALLRQHVNKLSKDELLRFFYETCQELCLMKDLLKLPLAPSEQECLERFLQGSGGYQNRELLMVHYLQQANYIPALQINQTLNMNLAGDRDPKMKERSNTRNSIMNQYGKVLPRAQRKLAMEPSKPYQRPPTILREVTRPQPLSAMAKRPNESVLSRAAFIKNVLTKIEEVWILRDMTPESSPLRSPKAPEAVESSPSPPAAALPQAFVGTPINMLTKRMSRLLDLAVHPSPSHGSPERSRVQTTPTKPLSSWVSPKHVSKAPELSLLQTPQVVKRARALASSGPVFSSFTPQSILRTSLRPTPIATPAGSPARSASPLLRSKESRITFLEESETVQRSSVRWSNGLAVEGASKLKRPSPPEGGVEAWSEHSAEEDEDDKDYKDQDKAEVEPSRLVLPPLERRPSLGHETSKLSVQSDSTLEFHDALSPAGITGRMNDTDEIVILGTTDPAEPHPGAPPGQPEESNSKIKESNQDDSVNQEKDSEPEPIRTLTTPEEPIADPNDPVGGTPPKESQSHAKEEEVREEAEPIREPPAPEVSETEAMETSDLDDYVERHLFGADLSPPYDHSAEAVDEADKPITSSEAATSESHSVVTLHDSDELSSTKSEQQEEEEEDDEDDDDEDDEEDSGSEVEIIQEVKGDSPQQQHLYLQDLPSEHDEDRFLEDQTAAAVLSLVSDPQLKMMDGCEEEEEGEVVMVGLEPASLGTDEAEVCYTELKPSTTLLVPIELSTDHQELLPDLGLPPGSNDFSLVLEADDEETAPAETIAHGDEENETRAPDSTDGAGTEPDHGARVEETVQSERPVEDQPEGTTEDQPEDQREDEEVEPVTESEPQEKDQPEKEAQTEEEPLEEPEEVRFDKVQDSAVSEEVQSERNEVVDRTDLPEVATEASPVGPDLSSDSTPHEEFLKPVEPQRSPGRRGRRTVTFLKSAIECEKDVSDEQSDPKVPSTPRRITRSSGLLPDSHVPVTPRRSARKVEPEPKEAAVPRASPGRKTPTRGTRKARSTSANSSDEEAQKTQSVPDRIPEEKGAETRVNTKASPSRVTRQSSRSMSLVLQSFQEFSEEVSVRTVTPPRSRRKTRGATEAMDETQLQNVSRRLTRSRHWHDDEDALQKTEALEVPNPLASALLERLNDTKESEAVTEIVRAKRRTTRSALESAPTEEPKEDPATEKEANTEIVHAKRRTTRSVAPPVAENANAEQKEKKKSVQSVRRTRASKVPESSSPPSESTSTSVHQSTRGRKKEVVVPDGLSPPVTRTRRAASVPEDEVQSDDIGVEAEAKPRKTRASRAQAAPVEINFLSPLPSPAERPRKNAEERGATAPKLSLRRKRVMEAVFPKPVTLRKKL